MRESAAARAPLSPPYYIRLSLQTGRRAFVGKMEAGGHSAQVRGRSRPPLLHTT